MRLKIHNIALIAAGITTNALPVRADGHASESLLHQSFRLRISDQVRQSADRLNYLPVASTPASGRGHQVSRALFDNPGGEPGADTGL